MITHLINDPILIFIILFVFLIAFISLLVALDSILCNHNRERVWKSYFETCKELRLPPSLPYSNIHEVEVCEQ